MTTAPIDVTGLRPASPADQPQPLLQWVAVADLVVDRRYQRDVTGAGRRAIQRIADGFDWRKFGAVMCAPAEGGALALVDGQHRAHAAALCGIDRIPAVIVPMTVAEQAAGFAAINRDKIRVDNNATLRAELAARTPWALEIARAVEAAGCKLGTYTPSSENRQPGTVFAPTLLRKMVEAGEAEAITAGLRAMRDSVQGVDVDLWQAWVIRLWLGAIATNQRFLRLPLARVFDDIDWLDVRSQGRAWAKATGKPATAMMMDRVIAILKSSQIEDAA
jgi:hypothetical protein